MGRGSMQPSAMNVRMLTTPSDGIWATMTSSRCCVRAAVLSRTGSSSGFPRPATITAGGSSHWRYFLSIATATDCINASDPTSPFRPYSLLRIKGFTPSSHNLFRSNHQAYPLSVVKSVDNVDKWLRFRLSNCQATCESCGCHRAMTVPTSGILSPDLSANWSSITRNSAFLNGCLNVASAV